MNDNATDANQVSLASVDVTFGNVQFKNHTAKIGVYVCATTGTGYKETHVFGLTKDMALSREIGVTLTSKMYSPSRPGVPTQAGGYYSMFNLTLDNDVDEVVLKVTASYSSPQKIKQGTRFFVIRRGGEVAKVEGKRWLKRIRKNGKNILTFSDMAIATGSMEPITAEEASVNYGVQIPAASRATTSPQMANDVMKHEVLQEAQHLKPIVKTTTVTTEDGKEVKVKNRFAPRRLG